MLTMHEHSSALEEAERQIRREPCPVCGGRDLEVGLGCLAHDGACEPLAHCRTCGHQWWLQILTGASNTAGESRQPVKLPGKTALILCGGGAKGAVEVGLFRAMHEFAIPIDLIVGSSIGALNGALIASGVVPDQLERLWLTLRTRALFRPNWQLIWKGRRADSIYTSSGIRDFIHQSLPVARFEQLRIPLYVNATDLRTGDEICFSSGELLRPLLGSIAVPGVFPPVDFEGCQLIDGGVSDNVPIAIAARHGARRAIFILCECCRRRSVPLHGFEAILSQTVDIMLHLKYLHDVGQYDGQIDLLAVHPEDIGRNVAMFDFSQTKALIEAGYYAARRELPRFVTNHRAGGTREPEQAHNLRI
jgi:NTE family protein